MLRLSLLGLCLLLVACDRPSASAPVASREEAGVEVLFPVGQGKVMTRLRCAVTDLEKSRGLMGTPKLPANEGMAFFYESDTQVRFWMKDTPLDLDIAFVSADGFILEIKTMRSGDTETTISSSDKVRFTVEMAAGWYAQSGVKVGEKVELSAVRQALTARGFQAKRYVP